MCAWFHEIAWMSNVYALIYLCQCYYCTYELTQQSSRYALNTQVQNQDKEKMKEKSNIACTS